MPPRRVCLVWAALLLCGFWLLWIGSEDGQAPAITVLAQKAAPPSLPASVQGASPWAQRVGKSCSFATTTGVCPPKVAGVQLPPRRSRRARGRMPARRTTWTSYSSAFLSLSPPRSKLYRHGRRPAFSRTQCHYPQTKLHNKLHNPEQILWTGSTRD